MKDLLICVLALTWVVIVIRLMGTRRHPRETPDHIDRDFREMIYRQLDGCAFMASGGFNRSMRKCRLEARHDGDHDMGGPFAHAHDEHGASTYGPEIIDQANRAHTTGEGRCPIHGSACGRAIRAKETGLSQTDEDVGRRADRTHDKGHLSDAGVQGSKSWSTPQDAGHDGCNCRVESTTLIPPGNWPGWPYKECREGRACHGKSVHFVKHYPPEYADGARTD